ncbi:MAG: hypothetical protein NQU46_06480 [Methanolinea sp.]|nr:hypothetical protein [Methanolinea sp.]
MGEKARDMSTHRFFIDHPIRAKKIKLTLGCCCELCGVCLPPEGLEIHTFSLDELYAPMQPAVLEEHLLVLCPRCHADVHEFSLPPADQEWLVRMRDAEKKKSISAILNYVPRRYTPPESDIEEAYREACSSRFRFGV